MSETKGTLFVTGGSGFVGGAVVRQLIAQGYSVRCLLRESSKTDRIDDLAYEKVLGDLLVKTSLVNGMQGCCGVIHLAAIANWADINSPKMKEVVVKGTANLLEAAQVNGNLPTVYVSSAAAINGTLKPDVQDERSNFSLPQKGFPYAQAKHIAEDICMQFTDKGLPVMIVNPAEVYGPNDRDMVTANTLIAFANSPAAMASVGGTSIVHVDDVAQGIIAAFERGKSGQRYILGGDNLTFTELAILTLKILERKKKVVTLPNWLIRFFSWVEGTFKINLGADPAVIPYATRYWFMNNGKAKSELGVEFRAAEDVLTPTLEWLVEQNLIEKQMVLNNQT